MKAGDNIMNLYKEPEPNMSICLGESAGAQLFFSFTQSYTIKNRLKWWLLCKILPFSISSWEK